MDRAAVQQQASPVRPEKSELHFCRKKKEILTTFKMRQYVGRKLKAHERRDLFLKRRR